jgi:hypothetical protein
MRGELRRSTTLVRSLTRVSSTHGSCLQDSGDQGQHALCALIYVLCSVRYEINVNNIIEFLRHVHVGDVSDVSELHTTSIFRVYVCKLGEF